MKVDIRDEHLYRVIAPDAKIEVIATGFDFLEGPIWHPVEQSLIFSDILGNSLYRWTEAEGVTNLRLNSYMANGNTYDNQGRVLTCEHATSRVTRTDFSNNGALEVLATHYQDKQLNSPTTLL
jgi:gluconolactonase